MDETALLPPDIAIDTVVEPTEAALALNRWHGFIPVCPGETAAPGGAVKLINAGESEAWYRHVHGLTADITLVKEGWVAPAQYPFAGGALVHYRAGEPIAWRVASGASAP